MKNLTFWELPSFFISGRNRFFGSFFGLLFLSGVILLVSCGPIPEEAARDKAYLDSAKADSLMRIEENKIKSLEKKKKLKLDSLKNLALIQKRKLADSLKTDSLNLGNQGAGDYKPDSLKKISHPHHDSTHKSPKHRKDTGQRIQKMKKDSLN